MLGWRMGSGLASGLKWAAVVVLLALPAAAQRTVSLFADRDVAVRDGNAFPWQADVNYSNRGTDRVAGLSPVADRATKILMRFDVTGLPAGAISQATLRVSVFNASSATVRAYPLLRAWVEAEATWNRASAGVPWQTPGASGGSDRGAEVAAFQPQAGGTLDVPLPVSLVDGWRSAPGSNFGLVLESPAMNDAFTIGSSRATTVTLRPRLVVVVNGTTVTLLEGQNGYQGLTDVSIANAPDPATYTSNTGGLEVEGWSTPFDPNRNRSSALVHFPLRSVPRWSTVLEGTVVFRFLYGSNPQPFPMFELYEPWSEQGTWLTRDGTTPWSRVGATGPQDRGTVLFGVVPRDPTDGGTQAFVSLTDAGLELLARSVGFVDGGFNVIVQDHDAGQYFGCTEREGAGAAQLLLTYVEGVVGCSLACAPPTECVITFTRTTPDGGPLSPAPTAVTLSLGASGGALDSGTIAFADGASVARVGWSGPRQVPFDVLGAPALDVYPLRCSGLVAPPLDAGVDAGTDAGVDAGQDSGLPDAGPLDAGPIDAGTSPDGGTSDDPLALQVGCGCNASGIGAAWALVLLGARRRRR